MKLWSKWLLKAEILRWDIRVALDWLFDRINLDPTIQIKYIDTKNKFVDILTKGNLIRDESYRLLCLTLAISVLQFAPLQWQNELNKNQEKNVSHSNQDEWGI